MSYSDPGRKEAIWLACKEKTCCYTSFVLPTGRDVWRISRILQTPAHSFLTYFESAQPRPDAFFLDASGRSFRIALAKQPSRRRKSPPPCIFLLRTRNGYHRCGLGDLRPEVCKTYPSEMISGVMCVRNDGGCTCRIWSLADVNLDEELDLVMTRRADYEEYCSLVAHWNSEVIEQNNLIYTFVDFCDFMLNAYDRVDEATYPLKIQNG